MADTEDRTEAASSRRLERARAEGNVAVSREVANLAGLGVATLMLSMTGPMLGRTVLGQLTPMLERPDADPIGALRQAIFTMALLAGPIILSVAAALVIAALLQTGMVFNTNAIMPDLARLSPMRGLKRIFGVRGLIEAGKSLVKLALFGFAAYHVLANHVVELSSALQWTPGRLAQRILQMVLQLMFPLLGLQVVVAGADTAWARFKHGRDLRMSKQDLRDEAKETDGNPIVKARLRQIRMIRAKKRMLAAVPKATVVITNPTHYAIALAYDRGSGGAPRVVAKGVDEVAARIREVASEHRIPLVANPPLARALYQVDLDAEIPAEHFKAVAEIIAYVWRLRSRAMPLRRQ